MKLGVVILPLMPLVICHDLNHKTLLVCLIEDSYLWSASTCLFSLSNLCGSWNSSKCAILDTARPAPKEGEVNDNSKVYIERRDQALEDKDIVTIIKMSSFF